MSASRLRVAFVGNPNAGKTSLFNALTGSKQRVGNFPGVTVERISATVSHAGVTLDCEDIPGLYSTKAVSEDELVAWAAIHDEPRPDVLVIVMDVTNLERHLFFYTQLSELQIPTVVALTMTDMLSRQGEKVDLAALEAMLGAKVIPVVAHKQQGTKELLDAVLVAKPVEGIPADLTMAERYALASNIRQASITKTATPRVDITKRLDRILTHRIGGVAVFVAVMYLLFQSIYTFAAPVQDFIDSGFGWITQTVGPKFDRWPVLQSLIVDGLITGVGGVLIFLPQILILFAFIAALEGSGYLARAAFLMDRLFGWCGLSGRAFVPLLSSFACAVPGIMAARVMPDHKSRLATILVAPLMSCSARLPVYILLIGVVIEPQFGPAMAGLALFAMHLLGVLVAIPVVLVLNRKVLKIKRLPFVLELPRYQWPKLRDVTTTMLQRAKVFVTTAGTIIVVMSMVIWALTYFPHNEADTAKWQAEYAAKSPTYRAEVQEKAYLAMRKAEGSYLGQFGRTIEPVFRPLGFDWRLSTSILAAFPAREVVVPSMGIMFASNSDGTDESRDLGRKLKAATWPDGKPLFRPSTAIGFMVFFALCCQCSSTLAAVKRETGTWKWPVFMFSYMTILAYLGAWIVHLIGG